MAENEESTDTPQAGSAAPAASAAESTVPASDTAKPAEATAARNVSSSPPRSSSGYGGGASRGGRPDSRGRSGAGGGGAGGRRFFRRRKVDFFSANKVDDINYKDADTLRQFIGDRGKILPRRHTGLSAQHQRLLKKAIKRARNIALLPFAGPGRPTGGGRSGPRAASRQE